MNVEIICVGTELLLGDIVNTNAAYLSKRFADFGLNCYYQTVIGDNANRLATQLTQSLSRSEIIVITGGLGPTYDDLTKETVAKVMDERLVLDDEAMLNIERHFASGKHVMTENNRKQAYVFEKGDTLQNERGTAPGLYLEKDGKVIILLPGPPKEMTHMFERSVVPYLIDKQVDTIVSHSVYLMDIGESMVESILHERMIRDENPTIAPYAKDDGVMLRVTAKAQTNEAAETLIEPVIKELLTMFHDNVFSVDEPLIEKVAAGMLKQKGMTVGFYDGLTGGMFASRLDSTLLNVVEDGTIVPFAKQALDESKLSSMVVSLNGSLKIVLLPYLMDDAIVGIRILVYTNGSVTEHLRRISRSIESEYDTYMRRASSFALKVIIDTIK